LVGRNEGGDLVLSVFACPLDVGDIPEDFLNVNGCLMDLKFEIIGFGSEFADRFAIDFYLYPM
jgi:hypothetical protein